MDQATTLDAPRSVHQSTTNKLWIASIATMILGAIIYAPALTGPAIWDDHDLLNGMGLGNAQSVWDCFRKPFLFHYYRPLTSLSFFLEHKLAGENPFLYHQTNLLLHMLVIGSLIGLLFAGFRNPKFALLAG